MNILIVSSFFLTPNTRYGGVKRLFYFVSELCKRNNVDLICFDGCQERPFGQMMTGPKSSMQLTHDQTGFSLHRLIHCCMDTNAIATGTDVHRFLKGKVYDACLLAFPLALSFSQLKYIRTIKNTVYLEDDLFFESVRKELGALRGLRRFKKWVRYHQILSYYRNRLTFVDTFLTISDQEKCIVNTLFPYVKTELLGYGIPIQEFPLQKLPENSNPVIGFIGNYKHKPNADALEYLLGCIHPLLRKKFTSPKILIAGRFIPDGILSRFKNDTAISWMENPDNLIEFYQRITVFINPIVSGRGLRTKMIEAAAFGRPIISTTLGAEGVEMLCITIADSSEHIVDAIIGLMRRPAEQQTQIRTNREIVEKQFSIEHMVKKLETALRIESGCS